MVVVQQVNRCALAIALSLLAGGCVTGGGDEAGVSVAMPTDTYETCQGGGVVGEGVNFLSGAGGARTVALGMSECALMGVLGDPVSVVPARPPTGGRHVTMTYANPDGTATSYTFVNNALREMNLVTDTPAAFPPTDTPG